MQLAPLEFVWPKLETRGERIESLSQRFWTIFNNE